jgi:hypothetical protein
VFFTGLHGISLPVDEYEHVFMVASGYGIIPQLPLLERLVQGALAHKARARRIRLVWELEDIGEYVVNEQRYCSNLCLLQTSLNMK